MIARRVGIRLVDRKRVFGGEHEPLAVGADELAHEPFALALGVLVGGINHVAARRGEHVEDLSCRVGLCPESSRPPLVVSEDHRAEDEFGHSQPGTAEQPISHRHSPVAEPFRTNGWRLKA